MYDSLYTTFPKVFTHPSKSLIKMKRLGMHTASAVDSSTMK